MKINIYGCVLWQTISQDGLQYTLIKMIVFCVCTQHNDNSNNKKNTYINI